MVISSLTKFLGIESSPKQEDVTATLTSSAASINAPANNYSVYSAPQLPDWFPPLMLSATTLANASTSNACLRQVIEILGQLEPDDILVHLQDYFERSLAQYGEDWKFADILTVLTAATQQVKPRRYLEIGVRRGRSMAMVASKQKDCEIYGFDRWTPNYAGMPNPGPDLVSSEMRRLGFTGKLEFINGNSHETVPKFFQENPEMFFDIITVDGDHSEKGATQDLLDVMPHITVGGVLVFDDICHPKHLFLEKVWQDVVVSDPRFTTWQYTDLGFGVAFAIRKSN
jgi:predicted O-methyltransferase YrrM